MMEFFRKLKWLTQRRHKEEELAFRPLSDPRNWSRPFCSE